MNNRPIIGVYDYTTILTFLSLVSALIGIGLAYQGLDVDALVCLVLCGMFDAFDGRVARTKVNRTESESLFGIQLDSLCDVIAFGIFPAFLVFSMGVKGPVGILILVFYCACGVMRLAYFNTRETIEFYAEEKSEHIYIGLPITSIAAILPVAFLAKFILVPSAFVMFLLLIMTVTAALFIMGFKLRKPKMPVLAAIGAITLISLGVTIVQSGYLVNILLP